MPPTIPVKAAILPKKIESSIDINKEIKKYTSSLGVLMCIILCSYFFKSYESIITQLHKRSRIYTCYSEKLARKGRSHYLLFSFLSKMFL